MNRRTITDLDASVVFDRVLLAADCYSSLWNPSLDRGDHAATRNRGEHLVAKLRDWVMKWQLIAADPPPAIRESGARFVLPVVVTAAAEWIPTEDHDVWFADGVPRICTVAELLRKVTTDCAGMAAHQIEIAQG